LTSMPLCPHNTCRCRPARCLPPPPPNPVLHRCCTPAAQAGRRCALAPATACCCPSSWPLPRLCPRSPPLSHAPAHTGPSAVHVCTWTPPPFWQGPPGGSCGLPGAHAHCGCGASAHTRKHILLCMCTLTHAPWHACTARLQLWHENLPH